MSKQVASIDLTEQEIANAVAERISHTRLTKEHFWNTYTLEIKIHGGEFVGGTIRYYLEADEQGRCPVCGCEFEDPRELTHECPPGFQAA